MNKNSVPYKKMVLVCTNIKEDLTKPCCGRKNGDEILTRLRDKVRESNLSDVIRVSKAGCLGKCSYGPNIMVFPEGTWYSEVKIEDIEEIIDDITRVND
ncbi:MAG: (2Fe-2S) ferredoxin domain-containing protein [Candidatus Hydrogenedentes bacterium]|nr:(2Fe-2S) ferredoxin domain-containing protein [Candidatus Hydrogenedentota bacterium]